MRAAFEKQYYFLRRDRETAVKGYFYEHGQTDALFKAYMSGYVLAKSQFDE